MTKNDFFFHIFRLGSLKILILKYVQMLYKVYLNYFLSHLSLNDNLKCIQKKNNAKLSK